MWWLSLGGRFIPQQSKRLCERSMETATRDSTDLQRMNIIPNTINSDAPEICIAVIVNKFLPAHEQYRSAFNSNADQVCGGWVKILPRLTDGAADGHVLSSAVRAFGATILQSSSQGESINFRFLEAYTVALGKLQVNISTHHDGFNPNLGAAILCLAMAEKMLVSFHHGSNAHFSGFSALISSCHPRMFASGILHSIYVGCRPILLFNALDTQTSTFLGRDEWKVIPFEQHAPSAMQNLITDVATLPSLLQGLDCISSLRGEMARLRALEIESGLLGVLQRLSFWKTALCTARQNQPHASNRVKDCIYPSSTSSTMPSIVEAYVSTFELICIIEVQKLRPYLENEHQVSLESSQLNATDGRISDLTSIMFQHIEESFQFDMGLHGPATAIFPLKVAYEVLRTRGERNRQQLERSRRLIAMIRQKGFSVD
ncbi:hypothetical protein K491DRAFT_234318 [Lophiostoma macrostomum CBS 122681]|uniref:Uncharacterized protein n=1 Tax=Lophiostoma macrostomum CBS 122681 TaxID=1314788 RepID=A0A6A6TG29_9PLEO|nr:hypothetical protein K491DRAFT_234318 [Lophiostoma macrostomum CBS 122681]